jgi:hypothetical protein
MIGEGALRTHDRLDRAAGIGEDDEELVAAVIDDVAVAGLHGLPKEPAVVGQDERVAVAELANELRRALDVGEDECDCAIGKIGCQSLLQGDLGPDAGSHAGRTVDGQLAA